MDQYIGRLLDDRYEILEQIGTGGMAVVYKARCHRLNRLVAVKILKDEYFTDEEFRRRFHHEGEAVAMLSHANIVQVYDVSSTDSADYIVMELIDGITLKQYMEKKGTLNWKETLHFSLQIAKALEHAHEKSIVHRDIKPHNIMVLKNGSVKVTDFGIARVMSKSNTLTKEALGSVHYISPEQAKGGWVDNRSDLYSLGVVMYEMMTGRPPYDGESPVAVAIQHINGGAAMPSKLNPNIPGGLEQIIMRSMALDAQDRYPTASEMLRDMEEFRKDPSILFVFPNHGVGRETKILPTSEQLTEASRQQQKTTAQKIAQNSEKTRTPEEEQRIAAARKARAEEAARRRVQEAEKAMAAMEARNAAEAARRNASRNGGNINRRTREEIREEIREEERNRMATIMVVTCSVVAIIAIVVFLILLVNGVLFNKSETLVTVPNFVGQYYDKIHTPQGLEIVVGGYTYSDTMEAGKITDQKPAYDSRVVQGSKVTVIVSNGPEPEVKIVPAMAGDLEVDARAVLTGLGMIPVAREEFHEEVEKGRVIRTEPAAGESLQDGQTVYIYISKGPVIEKIEMPDVVGMDYANAYNLLNQMGFETIVRERKDSDADKDEVIEQSVKKNTKVDPTEKIVLTVSKGPKETEPPKDEPTEKPTDPPEEKPTDPADKEKTRSVTISLPTDTTENYVLGIYKDGRAVVEDQVITAGTPSITVTLTGTGTQQFEIYINDVFYKYEKVDFS